MKIRNVFVGLLLAAVGNGAAAAQEAQAGRSIVITGTRPEDARRELEACIARNCPPIEDIAATLKYAESLFIRGDYRDSRTVLRRSISRNRHAAAQHPVGVAGLYRANARMAMHEGDGRDVRTSTYNVERALRAGLPERDPRVLGARLETAEMEAALAQARSGGDFPLAPFRRADRLFREVAQDAQAIGRPDIAALASLRRGMMAHRIGRPDGRTQIEAVAALRDPETRVQQLAARIVLAGIDRDAGDSRAVDRLVEEIAAMGLRAPVLIHAPPVKLPNAATTSGVASMGGDAVEMRNMSTTFASEGFDYWADVGFWIDGDGRVEDVELLRSRGPTHWVQPVLRSIEGRIYSPPQSHELAYRVERYRFTSLLERRSDRRILSHGPQGRIEMIDITSSADTGTGVDAQ